MLKIMADSSDLQRHPEALTPFDAKSWANPGQSSEDTEQIIANTLLGRSLQLQPKFLEQM